MKLLELTVNDLKEYSFCGIYYRMKRIHNFPYLPMTAEEVYADAMRTAFFSVLRDFGIRRKSIPLVIADAGKAFATSMDSNLHSKMVNPESMHDLYAQGLIILNTLEKNLNVTKDVVAATSVPHEVMVDDHTRVSGNLDALISRNDDNRADRYYSLLTAIDDRSLTAISNRMDDLHLGFARQAMLDVFKPTLDRPIVHQFFSLFANMRPPVRTNSQHIVSFKVIASKIAFGIRNKVFLPTLNLNRCKSCFFKEVCSNRFVEDTVPKRTLESAKATLKLAISEAKPQRRTM